MRKEKASFAILAGNGDRMNRMDRMPKFRIKD